MCSSILVYVGMRHAHVNPTGFGFVKCVYDHTDLGNAVGSACQHLDGVCIDLRSSRICVHGNAKHHGGRCRLRPLLSDAEDSDTASVNIRDAPPVALLNKRKTFLFTLLYQRRELPFPDLAVGPDGQQLGVRAYVDDRRLVDFHCCTHKHFVLIGLCCLHD